MLYLVFFFSGMAGLIYEISWARQIGLLFGHTVHAAAVVLAAYFAGMALGYWLAGRWATALRRPLLGYAVAEIVVAVWALATPLCLVLLKQPALAALLNHPQPAWQIAIRAAVAFLILLPATAALGATLPFIAQHLSPAYASSIRRISLAYALNTAGAVLGVLSATFVLILHLGVTGSSYLAAAVSGGCGLLAYALANRRPAAAGSSHLYTAAEPPSQRIGLLWYALAALSGAGTLGLEVLYTRTFALVFQNSTYTFGAVVAVFLLALALSGVVIARFGTRLGHGALALICGLGAVAIPVSAAAFQLVTRLRHFDTGKGFLSDMAGALGLTALIVMPPVTLLGLILPYTWLAVDDRRHLAGSTVGRLTAVNTLAAASGSLLTSFWLLPWLGLWPCFTLFALIYLLAALLLGIHQVGGWRTAVAGMPLVGVVAAGAYFIQTAHSLSPAVQRLQSWDTPYGYIDVLRYRAASGQAPAGDLLLRQDLHYVLGRSSATSGELRQGYLPLLLHPNPRKVLFLGLGTGITAAAIVPFQHIERSVAVELIPEVIEAARLFAGYNADILDSPRLQVVANDARHYLYAVEEAFDVIVSDLFIPWHSQTGYLYTVEHYRIAQQRLTPDGLFCQWLPLYQLGPRELELIADSFASVFPYTTVWRGESFTTPLPTLALIGSRRPLVLDAARLRERLQDLSATDTRRDPWWLRTPEDLVRLYGGDWVARRPKVLNTDEHPRLEFLAPIARSHNIRLTGERLQQYHRQVFAHLPRKNLVYSDKTADKAPD